jgi:hypothetical protein
MRDGVMKFWSFVKGLFEKKAIEAPAGWRWLWPDEIMQEGDMIWDTPPYSGLSIINRDCIGQERVGIGKLVRKMDYAHTQT